MKKAISYKVKVKTTNCSNNRVCVRNKDEKLTGKYFDCEDSYLFFITSDPRIIYDVFGVENVISITRIGVGYYIDLETK